jgi:hypothetical protein
VADTNLTRFVEEALRSGASRTDTEQALIEAGWSREQIRDALASYADIAFPVPVPRPRPQVTARDAFVYLVMFSMLYVSAWQLGNLLFQFINLGFPDSLSNNQWIDQTSMARRQIRSASASLLVAFPVFLLVARSIARRVSADPAQCSSAIRRWLTYLTLFVAACILVGDLIALLNGVLSGELTSRFVLKVLVVGGIAAGIFSYYRWSMRADDRALAQ